MTLALCSVDAVEHRHAEDKRIFRASAHGGGRNPEAGKRACVDRMLLLPRFIRMLNELDSLLNTAARSASALIAQRERMQRQRDQRQQLLLLQPAPADAKQESEEAKDVVVDAAPAPLAPGREPVAPAAAAAAAAVAAVAEEDDARPLHPDALAAEFARLSADDDGSASVRVAEKKKLKAISARLDRALCGGVAIAAGSVQLSVSQHFHSLKLVVGKKTLTIKWESIVQFAELDGKEAAASLVFDVCKAPAFKEKDASGAMQDAADFTPSAVAHAQTRYRLEFASRQQHDEVTAMLRTSQRLAAALAFPVPADCKPAAFDSALFATNCLGDRPDKVVPLAVDAAAAAAAVDAIAEAMSTDSYRRRCYRCGVAVSFARPHPTCFGELKAAPAPAAAPVAAAPVAAAPVAAAPAAAAAGSARAPASAVDEDDDDSAAAPARKRAKVEIEGGKSAASRPVAHSRAEAAAAEDEESKAGSSSGNSSRAGKRKRRAS